MIPSTASRDLLGQLSYLISVHPQHNLQTLTSMAPSGGVTLQEEGTSLIADCALVAHCLSGLVPHH